MVLTCGRSPRFRPDYLRAWIANPRRLVPYSAMPQNIAPPRNDPDSGAQDLRESTVRDGQGGAGHASQLRECRRVTARQQRPRRDTVRNGPQDIGNFAVNGKLATGEIRHAKSMVPQRQAVLGWSFTATLGVVLGGCGGSSDSARPCSSPSPVACRPRRRPRGPLPPPPRPPRRPPPLRQPRRRRPPSRPRVGGRSRGRSFSAAIPRPRKFSSNRVRRKKTPRFVRRTVPSSRSAWWSIPPARGSSSHWFTSQADRGKRRCQEGGRWPQDRIRPEGMRLRAPCAGLDGRRADHAQIERPCQS